MKSTSCRLITHQFSKNCIPAKEKIDIFNKFGFLKNSGHSNELNVSTLGVNENLDFSKVVQIQY